MRMIVANGGVTAGFDKNNRQPLNDQWEEGTGGLLGLLAGVVQEAFGDERPAAADSRHHDDTTAGGKSEFGGGDGNCRLVEIGEGVGKESDRWFPAVGVALKSRFLLVPPVKKGSSSEERRSATAIQAEQSICEPAN